MQKRWRYLCSLLLLSFSITSCIIVRSHDLQSPSQWPLERVGELNAISLSVTGHRHALGKAWELSEKGQRTAEGVIGQVYQDSGLFSSVSVAKASHGMHAEIRLTTEVTDPLAWPHALTLGVIPRVYRYTFTMATAYTDDSGINRVTITKTERYSWWYHPLLVFVMPFYESKYVDLIGYAELARATLDELRGKGP